MKKDGKTILFAAVLVLAGGIGVYAAVNHARNERLRLEAEEQHRLDQLLRDEHG